MKTSREQPGVTKESTFDIETKKLKNDSDFPKFNREQIKLLARTLKFISLKAATPKFEESVDGKISAKVYTNNTRELIFATNEVFEIDMLKNPESSMLMLQESLEKMNLIDEFKEEEKEIESNI